MTEIQVVDGRHVAWAFFLGDILSSRTLSQIACPNRYHASAENETFATESRRSQIRKKFHSVFCQATGWLSQFTPCHKGLSIRTQSEN